MFLTAIVISMAYTISFVTITTLGYGDIMPVTEVAKAFSVLEAIVGQFYLAVAVAWLVGMNVSKKSK